MLIKLSKLPDLDEKYGNRSLTKSNFTTFMYENFDLFGNMAREVFIESGQSEELTDFIIEVIKIRKRKLTQFGSSVPPKNKVFSLGNASWFHSHSTPSLRV